MPPPRRYVIISECGGAVVLHDISHSACKKKNKQQYSTGKITKFFTCSYLTFL